LIEAKFKDVPTYTMLTESACDIVARRHIKHCAKK
jgi:hypothetical protein